MKLKLSEAEIVMLYYTGFILSLIYSFSIIWSMENFNYFNFPIFWITGMAIITFTYRSLIPVIDCSILFIPYWYFLNGAGKVFIVFPLIATVIIFAGYKAKIRFVSIFVIIWFILADKVPFDKWNLEQYFIVLCVFAMVIIYLGNNFNTLKKFETVDILYCTYSSNTGHFIKKFIEGLKKGNSQVIEHHFHYYNEPAPVLNGDALVIAYPVYGWKSPWHFTSYMVNNLPPGKGRPAFIIYTSGGGPENGGLIPWIILTLKGYKVRGRAWGVYPINVATLRPLPGKFYKYLDPLLPWNHQLNEIVKYGEEFSSGNYSGYPVIIWPFFLIIAGFLLDNKWLNIVAYRNYAWKRRCNKCNICIKVCPVGRLYSGEDGYPRARGTCTLCLSCINLCPTNAMQLFGWTEYGRPYKPKWPEFLKKNSQE